MRIATNRGVKVFRLTSWSRNKAAHRSIARIDFKESSRISVYEPGKKAKFAPQKGVRLAGMHDLALVTKLIRESREFRLGSGVFWDAFTAASLNPSVIKNLVGEGSVWIADESIAVARLGGEGGETWRQVCFLTGKGDTPVKLVRHVFGLKKEGKAARRIVYLPQGSHLIGTLRREGFSWLTSLILFERAAAKG
jgi:hypothetical protein